MTIVTATNPVFTVGGTVQAGNGRYLERQADRDLLTACQNAEFAFVLTSRQTGKSSLMVRTAQALQAQGTRAAIVDLNSIGGEAQEEQWYLGFLSVLEGRLHLNTDAYAWWKTNDHLSAVQRFSNFLEQVVLPEMPERIVIFVDEIDATIRLKFSSDFFAAIRSLYLARAEPGRENLKRLSFVLIGVATPTDLIPEAERTPFNIGRRVDLNDFTLEEAMPLAAGFDLPETQARQVLERVLHWTNGHPYLTQRLCKAIAEHPAEKHSSVGVDESVNTLFFSEQGQQDHSIQFVRDMLTQRPKDPDAVLTLYRDVLQGTVQDDQRSWIKAHLKLSGAVASFNSHLRSRNQLFGHIFNLTWTNEQLLQTDKRRKKLERSYRVLQFFVVAMVPIVVALVFFIWNRIAQAERGQLAFFDQLALRSQTQIQKDLSLALLLATKSSQLGNSYMTKDSLLKVLQAAFPTRQILYGHTLAVFDIKFSQNGKMLGSTSDDGTIRLWNSSDGAFIRIFKGHTDSVFSLEFSPDGEILVSAGADKTINLWNLHNGNLIRTLKGHTGSISSVAFSPDGKTLASGSIDQTIRLWNPTNGNLVRTLKGHTGSISSVVFSPDGKTLASGSIDQTIRLWNPTNGNLIQTLKGHTGSISSVVFSPDGKTLASGSIDQTIRLWQVKNGRNVQQFNSQTKSILSLAVSQDGRTLAVAGESKTIWLWSIKTGTPIQELKGHTNFVRGVAFSPDGRTLASASDDKTVRLWNTNEVEFVEDGNVQSLRARACRIANRNLSLEEWNQFLGDTGPYQKICPDLPIGENPPTASK
jgi:WD40 repeat protein